jgi:hypothetical protein
MEKNSQLSSGLDRKPFGFVEGDFDNSGDGPLRRPAHEIANLMIQKWLAEAPTVFSHNNFNNWHQSNPRWADEKFPNTHRAKLVCIEEIKK